MNIFFCDITGTINGNEENRNEQLLRLAYNLQNMCDNLDIKELYFDFISTEEMNIVLQYVEEIIPFLDKKHVKLGTQFSNKEKYYNGRINSIKENTKIAQIYNFLDDNSIKRIILADDSFINHKILRHVINNKRPDIEFISLIPNFKNSINNSFYSPRYGIEGLNEALESYINSFYNYKKI